MSILEDELDSMVHGYLQRIDKDLADNFKNIKSVKVEHNIPTLPYIYTKVRPSYQEEDVPRKRASQGYQQNQTVKLQCYTSSYDLESKLKIPGKQSLKLKKRGSTDKNIITQLEIPDEMMTEEVKYAKAKKKNATKNTIDTYSSDSEDDQMIRKVNFVALPKSKSLISSKTGDSRKTNAISINTKSLTTQMKSRHSIVSNIGAVSKTSHSSNSDSNDDDHLQSSVKILKVPETKLNPKVTSPSDVVPSSSSDSSSENETIYNNNNKKYYIDNKSPKKQTIAQTPITRKLPTSEVMPRKSSSRKSTSTRKLSTSKVRTRKSSSSSDSSNNEKQKTNIRHYTKGKQRGPINIARLVSSDSEDDSSDNEAPKHLLKSAAFNKKSKPKTVTPVAGPCSSDASDLCDKKLTTEQALLQNQTPNESSVSKFVSQKKNQTSNSGGHNDGAFVQYKSSSSDKSSEEPKRTECFRSGRSSESINLQKKYDHLKQKIKSLKQKVKSQAKVKSVPQRSSPQKNKLRNSSESSSEDSSSAKECESQMQSKGGVSSSIKYTLNIPKSSSSDSEVSSDEPVSSNKCKERNIVTKPGQIKELTECIQNRVSNEIGSHKNDPINVQEKHKNHDDDFKTPLLRPVSHKLNKKRTLSEMIETITENRAERSRKLSVPTLIDTSKKNKYSDIVMLQSQSSDNESDGNNKESKNFKAKLGDISALSHSKLRKSSELLNDLEKHTQQNNSSEDLIGDILSEKYTPEKVTLADKIAFESDSDDSLDRELKNKLQLSKSESSEEENKQNSTVVMGSSMSTTNKKSKSEISSTKKPVRITPRKCDSPKTEVSFLSKSEEANHDLFRSISSQVNDEGDILLEQTSQRSQQTTSKSPQKCTNSPEKRVMTQREQSVDLFASQSYSERRKFSIMKSIEAIANSTASETDEGTFQTGKKRVMASPNKKQKSDHPGMQESKSQHSIKKVSEVATPNNSRLSSDSDTIENSQLPLSQSSKLPLSLQRESDQYAHEELISDADISTNQKPPLLKIHVDREQSENETDRNVTTENRDTSVEENADIGIYVHKRRKQPKSVQISDVVPSKRTSPTKAKHLSPITESTMSKTLKKEDDTSRSEKTSKKTSTSKNEYKCSYCDYTTINRIWLISHNRNHTGAKPIRFGDNEEIIGNNVEADKTNADESEELTQDEVDGFQCILCDFKTLERHNLVKHIMKHTEHKDFHCKIRTKVSKEKSPKHIKTPKSEISETVYECHLCNFRTTRLRNLKMHETKIHADDRLHKCEICEETFKRLSELNKHAKIHQTHKCTDCDKEFKKEGQLRRHVRTHTKEGYLACDSCDKSFPARLKLERHIRTHTKEGYLACDSCDKSFPTRRTLERHMQTHIKGKIECHKCDKSFTSEKQLDKHSKTHKDFKCHLCTKQFSTQTFLEKHSAFHISKTQSPTRCELCEEIFPVRAWYVRHMKKSHKDNLVCNECHIQFQASGKYKHHMKNHEKGFCCDQCNFRGQSSHQLTKHMYKHTKPHVCDICGKGFAQSSHLSKHSEVHSKLYKCDICSNSFDTEEKYECHVHGHNNAMKTPRKVGEVEQKIKPENIKKDGNLAEAPKVMQNESHIEGEQIGEGDVTGKVGSEIEVKIKSHKKRKDRDENDRESQPKKQKREYKSP